ncbi:hypothetical protein HOF65_01365 [bacterium]|nr:hypothetical protein [bacterium]MBT3852681.1 hypothetical protein [bacterium]MBT4632837.1 hypothetical protein [bacterium]MBT5491761.1 hypothetical protein [bacterium]MBT6779490.1 hypothetical protein [bacterium]
MVFSFTLSRIICEFFGSSDRFQIVSNLRLSSNISHKKDSILLINFIIHSTSFFSLFLRLFSDKAHSVKYFIHCLSASLVILITLSAHALCQATDGNNLDLAHLRFQSIIIHK